VIKIK